MAAALERGIRKLKTLDGSDPVAGSSHKSVAIVVHDRKFTSSLAHDWKFYTTLEQAEALTMGWLMEQVVRLHCPFNMQSS